jgi:hypothetical protein
MGSRQTTFLATAKTSSMMPYFPPKSSCHPQLRASRDWRGRTHHPRPEASARRFRPGIDRTTVMVRVDFIASAPRSGMSVRYLREADRSDGLLLARLNVGYCFFAPRLSMQFIPVRLRPKPRANRFHDFREPARKLLNTNELIQHLEIAVLKPGVRGLSSLRESQ